MKYHNQAIAGMGSSEGEEYKLRTVSVQKIKEVRELAEKAGQKA
jgi:copper homeostasis protein